MSESRFVVVQYCDDIRHEIGNKYSLIGCYGPELLVGKLPVVLPKLCALVRVQTPIERPFEKLVTRAILNGEIIAEIDLSPADLESMNQSAKLPDQLGIAVISMMVFTPLAVTESCKLQIEAETEDGVIRGNSLRMSERTEA